MKRRKNLPPAYLLIFIILQMSLHLVLPLFIVIPFPYKYIGILLIVIGIWINIWADTLFHAHNTTIEPFEKPSYLVKDGPFSFSRNPMYLGMTLILCGIAFLLGSVMPFVLTVVFAILTDIVFIRQEEKYLNEVFGSTLSDYKKHVRRWI